MRRSRQILSEMREIEKRLERLDAAIITQYPDSERATDEYTALRKAVNASASATTLHRHSLISLVNVIDDGANSQTVRAKIIDLMSTLSMVEVAPSDVASIPQSEREALFEEVGDKANPRSAWIRKDENGFQVLERGYVRTFPKVEATEHALDGQDFLVEHSSESSAQMEVDSDAEMSTVDRAVSDETEGGAR